MASTQSMPEGFAELPEDDSGGVEIIELPGTPEDTTPIVAHARSMQIVNAESYSAGTDFLRQIVGAKDRMNAFFRPSIQKAHELHKQLLGDLKTATRPLEDAEGILRTNCVKWYDAEERRRQEEQRRLQAEERERQRKIAEEEARLRREEAEKLAREAEAQRKAGLEAEALATEQAAVEAQEEALLIVEEAAAAPPPAVVLPSSVPNAAMTGMSYPTLWNAEVVDLKALCQGVVEGRVPVEAICANMPFLNKQAKAFKSTNCPYPGVKFIGTRGTSVRR